MYVGRFLMVEPVLVDLDETVYPFIHTWGEWLKLKGTDSSRLDVFRLLYDLDLHLEEHVELQPDFIAAQKHLKPKPIIEALTSLQKVAQFYPIVALTARNREDWYDETAFWLGKHLPFIEDVHYSRVRRGGEATHKHVIADSLNAYALIDDSKHWVDGLPEHIRGYVVQRPEPLMSDVGAKSWAMIAEELVLLHPNSAV